MSAAGIIGLGLIGGSLARDLSAAGWRVQGTDRDAATEAAARQAGITEGPIAPDGLDVIILAVPVRAAAGWLRYLGERISDGSRVVVTDVGSTKRSVLEAAGRAGLAGRFVGGHPMAGDDRSGWEASRTGLFRGARVWLCPAPWADGPAIQRVEAMWRTVGARPRPMDAAAHDRLLARTSHLPQVVATALGLVLDGAGHYPEDLGPGGRDATRLAGSDPGVWIDILLDNAADIGDGMDELIGVLTGIRAALADGREDILADALAAGHDWARRAGGR